MMRLLTLLAVIFTAVQASGNYYFLSTTDCEKITDKNSCSKASCSWCTSGAVGASCMTNEDAAALPSSVFTCTAGKKLSAGLGGASCEVVTSESKCMTSSQGSEKCAWCTSGAVGASCMTQSDAQGLPSSVFQCQYQSALEEAKGLSAGLMLANEPTVGVSGATIGVDVSSVISSSAASCLKNGYGAEVIPRGYHSSGSIDTNMCTSLKSAQAAGIAKRSTYIFPCPTCSKSAQTQMNELVSSIKSCGSAFSGKIWLDIEGTQYWSSSLSTNQAFYKGLVDACKSSGYPCGVYTSASQWNAIFGSSFVYGNNLPLWYPHYESTPNPSFSDFKSFGGWTAPYGKQYAANTVVCSVGVDLNYMPYA